MALMSEFYTSGSEDGDNVVFHNQSQCGYGLEIIRNGNKIEGKGEGRELCERCADIAAGF